MKTLFVVNDMSGGREKIPLSHLIDSFGGENFEVVHLSSPYDVFSPFGFDRIVVLGGDGTLNNVLNLCKDMDIEILYYACGTFNEKAKIKNAPSVIKKIGRAGDKLFSYVCACGTFTEIGYRTKTEAKKRFKIFAYMAMAFKTYKVRKIPCELNWNGKNLKGDFTLVMILDSPRCFGFNFNRLYGKDPNQLFLLAIKTPKAKGIFGKIALFFPFFRAFFMGFSKEKHGKKITFTPFTQLNITCPQNTAFCLDGEKWMMGGEFSICKREITPTLRILKEDFKKR